MASVKRRADGKWRARYRDDAGTEHARHFGRKVDARQWLDRETSKLVTGAWVAPKTARTTVEEWSGTWLGGYATRRPSTVAAAAAHLDRITGEFGPLPLASVRPSHVRSWTAKLREEGLSESYVYVLYKRLSQLMADAVHDGLIPRSPCSRRTSPGAARQRPYVATTAQVWALHDQLPERYRAAVLLGAFVGLRTAETCGLRVDDVDFMRGIVHPRVQWPAEPLKTEISRMSVPIPRSLALDLAAQVKDWPAETVLSLGEGRRLHPRTLERYVRTARTAVDGLPDSFRYHDLRHYFASLLIASGSDVKVVQARLRHASARTTLDTYGHLWPDSDESTREAVDAAVRSRGNPADSVRTRRETR